MSFLNDVYYADTPDNKLYKLTNDGLAIGFPVNTAKTPTAVLVTSDKKTVIVTNYAANSISFFEEGVLQKTIQVGKGPMGVCESINGHFYVSNFISSTVSKVTPEGVVIKTIPVGRMPKGICCDKDGTIYTANYGANSVTKIVRDVVVETIRVGLNPSGICVDKLNTVWVANTGSHSVSHIDKVNSNVVNVQIPNSSPHDICVDLKGTKWVTGYASNKVYQIIGDAVMKGIDVGDKPFTICCNDANEIYVFNSNDTFISKINGDTAVKIPVKGKVISGAYGDPTGMDFHYISKYKENQGGGSQGGGGTLKPNSVSWDMLDQNLKDRIDAVKPFTIADGSIVMKMLSAEVQAKLNAKLDSVEIDPSHKAIIPPGSIGIDKIDSAFSALLESKLSKIADGYITLAMLSQEVKDKFTLGAGSITLAMLAQEVLDKINAGGGGGGNVTPGSITEAMLDPALKAKIDATLKEIPAGMITKAMLATELTTLIDSKLSKIEDNSVTIAMLAQDVVDLITSSHGGGGPILPGTITEAMLHADLKAVINGKMSKIEDGSITSAKLATELINKIDKEIEASGVKYDNVTLDTVKKALDELFKKYKELKDAASGPAAPEITSFTNDKNEVEVGSTVTDVKFDWVVNRPDLTLTIDNGVGDVSGATTKSVTGLSLTNDTTYTLKAEAGTRSDTKTTKVIFLPKIYGGVVDAAPDDSAKVLALEHSVLAKDANYKHTFDCSAGNKYISIAVPQSYSLDVSKFKVGGFANNNWSKTVVSVTNASGHTANYDIFTINDQQSGSAIEVAIEID